MFTSFSCVPSTVYHLGRVKRKKNRACAKPHPAICSPMKHITKTCLYNFDPLELLFYILKLGFTRVYIIFLISAQKHRL